MALSMDGPLLASGSFDGTVRLWEVPGGRPLAALQGHTCAVWGMSLSAYGRYQDRDERDRLLNRVRNCCLWGRYILSK